MTPSAWLSAAALLLLAGSAALAQGAPPQASKPPPPSTQAGPSKPVSGAPKAQPTAPRPQRPTQPAGRAKPNTTYSYCRGVARYMGLRGAERRKTILDCQLGVMPSISKG